MMKRLIVSAALFCASQLNAASAQLLPSQEDHDLITVKTCRDHEVLSSLKAAIDSSLRTSSNLASSNIHLEAVRVDRPTVVCSTTVAAKGIRDRIVYSIALEGSSYVIKFGGQAEGSKLFPYQLEVRPKGHAAWLLWTDCDPSAAML